jgi:hypothetical protein
MLLPMGYFMAFFTKDKTFGDTSAFMPPVMQPCSHLPARFLNRLVIGLRFKSARLAAELFLNIANTLNLVKLMPAI